jgi:hypothetical protein
MKDCNDCPHMNPKESNQTKAKEPHICGLTGRRVRHIWFGPPGMSHPDDLPSPDWCPMNARVVTEEE